jgi:hypothetical protein
MAVSKRLRFEILRRDNHQCRYCGRCAPDVKLTVDHVVPETLGGSDDPANLVAACSECNGGKSSVPADAPTVADVGADAIRWASAMEQAAALDRQRRSSDVRFVADFIDQISVIIKADPDELQYCMPDMTSAAVGGAAGFRKTITKFRDCGLNLGDLDYAIRKAAANRAIDDQNNWKYFCGICWRMVQDRQETARALLEVGEGGA